MLDTSAWQLSVECRLHASDAAWNRRMNEDNQHGVCLKSGHRSEMPYRMKRTLLCEHGDISSADRIAGYYRQGEKSNMPSIWAMMVMPEAG